MLKRDIVFRGKSKSTGEWVEGSLIGNDVIVGKIVEFEEDYFCTEFWYKVDTETVGQFTGMTDKKGKKLFEGDVYSMGEKNILYVVIFDKSQFIGKQVGNRSLAGLEYWKSDIEIIGNVYDNPELL